MKLVADRQSLVRALGLCARAIPGHTPKPVLQSVRLTADDDCLKLDATNLDIYIVGALVDRVDVLEPGVCLGFHSRLSALLKSCDDDTVTIGSSGAGGLVVRTKAGTFCIEGGVPADYPTIPEPPAPAAHVRAADLADALHATAPAVSKEPDQYAITGHMIDERCIVATNRHLLHQAKINVGRIAPDGQAPPVVPKALVNACLAAIAEDEGVDAGLSFASGRFAVRLPRVTVMGSVVEGNFPPYLDIIPKNNDKIYTLCVPETLAALSRVRSFTDEESTSVRLSFSGCEVEIAAKCQSGSGSESVSLASSDGEELEIGFNPQYLADAIGACGADVVSFKASKPNKTAVIEGGSVLALLMPINLR